MNETTILFDKEVLIDKNTRETLKGIVLDLNERGYDAIRQIVGYLVSGDPGYISSYKECRQRIQTLDRNSVLELMLKNYVK